MKLGKKLDYARQHVASIMRHDSAPIAAREEAAKLLRDYLDAELTAAVKRNAEKAKAELKGE